MNATIDEAGRLVIPREIRRAAGLEPGMALDIRVDDGAVIIEPAPTPVRIARRGRFLVARPRTEGPPLTEEAVRRTRDEVASERGGAGSGRRRA